MDNRLMDGWMDRPLPVVVLWWPKRRTPQQQAKWTQSIQIPNPYPHAFTHRSARVRNGAASSRFFSAILAATLLAKARMSSPWRLLIPPPPPPLASAVSVGGWCAAAAPGRGPPLLVLVMEEEEGSEICFWQCVCMCICCKCQSVTNKRQQASKKASKQTPLLPRPFVDKA